MKNTTVQNKQIKLIHLHNPIPHNSIQHYMINIKNKINQNST
jgi:hypothetical protein